MSALMYGAERVFQIHMIQGRIQKLLLGGGRQSLGGRLPNILIIFSRKPYEIKEILVRMGGATVIIKVNSTIDSMAPKIIAAS